MGRIVPTITHRWIMVYRRRCLPPSREYEAIATWGGWLTTRGADRQWKASLKALAAVVRFRLFGRS